jgi:ribose 5-phosphate isomerase A
MMVAEQALTLLRDGMTLGLGSGRAATAFLRALAERIRGGLTVRGVATSHQTAGLARELGIPLMDLDAVDPLDIAFDGADEVDPNLNLIKGYGGALVREKIVAASARRLVILVGAEKRVDRLGAHGKLPIEIVPFAWPLCRRKLTEFGLPPVLRLDNGQPFRSDNGNYLVDCRVTALSDPATLEAAIEAVPGVVGTGLFLGMADLVLVQDGDAVHTLPRQATT